MLHNHALTVGTKELTMIFIYVPLDDGSSTVAGVKAKIGEKR